jgi:hypothetical protein
MLVADALQLHFFTDRVVPVGERRQKQKEKMRCFATDIVQIGNHEGVWGNTRQAVMINSMGETVVITVTIAISAA